MNPQDSDPSVPSPEDGAAPAEAAPKPRRRRAAAPAAAAPEAPAAVTTTPPADVALADEAPAKPKRTRRKVVDVIEEVAEAVVPVEAAAVVPDAAPDPAVPPAGAPAKAVRARKSKPAPVVAAADAGATAPVVAESIVAESIVERPAPEPQHAADAMAPGDADSNDGGGGEGGEGGGEGGEGGGEASEGPRRRNRNRRRRRGQADRNGAEGVGATPMADSVAQGGAEAAASDDDDDEDAPAPAVPAPMPPADAAETFADVLSGAYDALPAEDTSEAATPERRVLAAEPDAPKLHKVLAQAGIGSRRDMEQLIADGQVTVNGQVAHTGQRISFGDQIKVAGKPVKVRIAPPLPRILAYHKPTGEVVTHDDPQHRPTVFRRLPRLPQGKWQSVGRLDINTEGLLLFTNSGELANQLMHPRFGVEREYAVRVLGALDEDARESLLEGVDIDGQRAAFKSIADGGGEGANRWYRVVITEGRNREVRKLFDSVGHGVSRLIRIRYGCVVLPRGLKRGVFVDLNEAEVRELRRMAGGRDGQGGQNNQGPRPQQQGQGEGGGKRRNRRGGQNRDRGDRNDRPDRPDRAERQDRPPREPFEGGPIPNPLQQTFDKRAIREARQPKREYSEDGPIPNPLEQTYDKRFVQKQRGPGGGGRNRGDQGGGGGGQPDPMKTSLGYIGADAFVRKFQGGGGGGGRGGRRRGGR